MDRPNRVPTNHAFTEGTKEIQDGVWEFLSPIFIPREL